MPECLRLEGDAEWFWLRGQSKAAKTPRPCGWLRAGMAGLGAARRRARLWTKGSVY